MSTETLLPLELAYPLILGSCVIGFLFGILNWANVKSVDTEKKPEVKDHILLATVNKKDGSTTTPLETMNKTSVLIQNV
jgi:hypothetical protein